MAAVISLLANAELFMLLGHRDAETAGGPADPAVVMVDLPAPPAGPPDAAARPDEQPPPSSGAEAPPDPEKLENAPRVEAALPPPPVTPPIASLPPLAAAEAVPTPVPRPRRPPRLDRGAVVSRQTSKTPIAARPSPGSGIRHAHRFAAAAAVAGPTASSADWRSQVVAALNRAKHYPDGSDANGSPTVRMMVSASGDVARVTVVASSGSSALDTAAVETVRRTSPLPPPPGGATGLTFRMNFHLFAP